MSQITYGSCLVSDQDLAWIDRHVQQLSPQLDQIDDELPIFDIIVSKGKKPGRFHGSVAIFLPDATIHAHADSSSIDQAVKESFAQAAVQVRQHHAAAQRRHASLRKMINQAKIVPVAL